MSFVAVYAVDVLPPKDRAASLAGTPVGLQFVDVLQLPVIGAVAVPLGPSQAGSLALAGFGAGAGLWLWRLPACLSAAWLSLACLFKCRSEARVSIPSACIGIAPPKIKARRNGAVTKPARGRDNSRVPVAAEMFPNVAFKWRPRSKWFCDEIRFGARCREENYCNC
jgi:hypothetical protein